MIIIFTNYYNNIIEPVLSAITLEMQRKFLTSTGRSQGQAVRFYRDPFKLIPVKDLAELADKFTRNEIASSNEIRTLMGWKPSDDPKADQLVNANLNQSPDEMAAHGEEGAPQIGSNGKSLVDAHLNDPA